MMVELLITCSAGRTQVCLPPIRNYLKTTFVPVGFWSRLMSRLFADASIELLAKEGCGITKENEGSRNCICITESSLCVSFQLLHQH